MNYILYKKYEFYGKKIFLKLKINIKFLVFVLVSLIYMITSAT